MNNCEMDGFTTTKSKTLSLVRDIKEKGEDFEWYPTTEEILECVKSDITEMVDDFTIESHPSILDCGAGDGRSLMFLTEGKRYAIEKSESLIFAMDRNIYVIGADFHQQTLVDKNVDITFCNPPYSEFSSWATKIIRESRSGYLYLVLPKRWTNDSSIQQAIKLRNGEVETLGSFDFLNAEREARAVIDVVKIRLAHKRHSRRNVNAYIDPFELWFQSNFKVGTVKSENTKTVHNKESLQESVKNALVAGSEPVSVLVQLYERDLDSLVNTYKAFEQLDSTLLNELGVSFNGVREGLKQKISGLKNLYWRELFDRFGKITDKLCKKSREEMLDTLTRRTDVDFNASNVYAVVTWCIKNANHYYDDQLIHLVERLTEQANVLLYKSNSKTFGNEDWGYCRMPADLTRYFLETRCILHRCGGISISDFSYYRSRYNGLAESAYFFLKDTLTVASNLGFDASSKIDPMDFTWTSGKSCDFYYKNHTLNKDLVLMRVKAFKNGNLHIKFNQAFMMKLNIEFGRLKGWLKNAQEASNEVGASIEDANLSFKSNLCLNVVDFPKLVVM